MKRLPISARPHRVFLTDFRAILAAAAATVRVTIPDGVYSAVARLIQLRPALESSATSFVAEARRDGLSSACNGGCVMAKTYRVAVIAGDGIGREVVPEGIAALEEAARRYGFALEWREFDWSCETYAKTGRMMPEDGLDQLRSFDAVFLGAVGYPGVPDHVSLWGLLIPLRRHFHQYINLRPVRLLAGVDTPLKNRAPGDIDFYVVRENNEGEYSEIGGRLFSGTENEMAMQEAVFTRRGCDRVMRYAFELARTRKHHVTSATKSNGIIHTMPFWDERFAAVARDYPDVKTDQSHIDIL